MPVAVKNTLHKWNTGWGEGRRMAYDERGEAQGTGTGTGNATGGYKPARRACVRGWQ